MCAYITYENYTNRHVTIHKVHNAPEKPCGHIKKNGGQSSGNVKQKYINHDTIQQAESYAAALDLPIKKCRCLNRK